MLLGVFDLLQHATLQPVLSEDMWVVMNCLSLDFGQSVDQAAQQLAACENVSDLITRQSLGHGRFWYTSLQIP